MNSQEFCDLSIPLAYLKISSNMRNPNNCSSKYHPIFQLNYTNNVCNAFKIITDSGTGKYIVATKDLPPGVIIVEEGPLAYAPVNISLKDNFVTCITCGKTVASKSCLPCLTCKWPFCSARCQWHKSHTRGECEMFTFKEFKYEQLLHSKRDFCYILLMIRTFRLAQQQPDSFRELMSIVEAIPDNTDFGYSDDHFENLNETMNWFPDFADHESLNKIMRLCNTKGISTDIFHPKPEQSLTFIYSKASLFTHSCAPNCAMSKSPHPYHKLRIRTTVPVKAGDRLCVNFLSEFSPIPTYKRQQKIVSRMGQPCKCRRCTDPTEFGTYLSAISCKNCQNLEEDDTNFGYLLPNNPTDIGSYSMWKCNSCGGMQLASKFLPKVEVILEQLKSKEVHFEKMLLVHKFLRFCNAVINGYQRTFLHPNHWLLQEATNGILKYQNSVVTRISSTFGVEQLDLYISHYEYLLAVQGSIFPGVTLQRAYLQRKLCQMLLFKILKAPNTFEPKELRMEIERCRKIQQQVFHFYAGYLSSEENPSFQLNEFILEMHVASNYSSPGSHQILL